MNWPESAKLKLLARLRTEQWRRLARTEQLPPKGEWRYWYLRGGRGSGKTRTGAETLADWILDNPPGEWAIIAPTFADARDVCVEGPSGILKALGGAVRREDYKKSHGILITRHGSRVYLDGADDGAYRIQGKNLRGAWCDEIGLWKHRADVAWKESLRFAVRLDPARFVITGTPKQGNPLVRSLLREPRCVVTHMRTIDNAANLDRELIDELYRDYEGSRLGRQELGGEFLEDVPGALWTLDLIEAARLPDAPEMAKVIVGVDPSGSADENTGTSETGIVVAGRSSLTDHGYVLGDHSMHGSPDQWARKCVWAYREYDADLIVAERNFGGEMVRTTIRAVDPNVPVKLVTASRGKRVRAEPIAAKYEQERVHHVGTFPRLEDQMTQWVPDTGMDSPDRMDALVWALTELLVTGGQVSQHAAYGDAGDTTIRIGDLVLDEQAARKRGYSYVDRS